MEKISSILPSNPRIKTVDTEESHPSRPGSPSNGRRVGATPSDRDRLSISPLAKEAAFSETLAKKNPREEDGAKQIERMTKQFFGARMQEIGEGPMEEAGAERIQERDLARVNVQPKMHYPNGAPEAVPSPVAEVSGHSLNKYA